MKILMVLANQVSVGTYWRAFHLAKGLVYREHQVTAMLISRNTRLKFIQRYEQGVTIVETPDWMSGMLRSGWDPFDTLARIRWLHGKEFDIVHAFESRPVVLLPALYLRYSSNAKLVMDWCDWLGAGGSVEERTNPLLRTVYRPIETFFEERFRTLADGSLTINTVLQERLWRMGVSPETVFLLRNGSDPEALRPRSRTQARQKLDLPNDVEIVGYIGAIYKSDAELMAEAFDIIHETRPDTRLLVIGHCKEEIGPLVKSPQAVYQSGRIPTRLINDYLAACDLCWLPLCNSTANQGRFPGKLYDYVATGRAVVATAVGDVPDLIETYSLGLVAADEPEDLADKVLRLLENPKQRQVFEKQARHAAETVFNWKHRITELETFYKRVLDG